MPIGTRRAAARKAVRSRNWRKSPLYIKQILAWADYPLPLIWLTIAANSASAANEANSVSVSNNAASRKSPLVASRTAANGSSADRVAAARVGDERRFSLPFVLGD